MTDAGSLLLAGLAGALLGLAWLAILRRAVRSLAASGNAGGFAALALARAALVVAAVAGSLRLGATAADIAAALAGFTAIRLTAPLWRPGADAEDR